MTLLSVLAVPPPGGESSSSSETEWTKLKRVRHPPPHLHPQGLCIRTLDLDITTGKSEICMAPTVGRDTGDSPCHRKSCRTWGWTWNRRSQAVSACACFSGPRYCPCKQTPSACTFTSFQNLYSKGKKKKSPENKPSGPSPDHLLPTEPLSEAVGTTQIYLFPSQLLFRKVSKL